MKRGVAFRAAPNESGATTAAAVSPSPLRSRLHLRMATDAREKLEGRCGDDLVVGRYLKGGP